MSLRRPAALVTAVLLAAAALTACGSGGGSEQARGKHGSAVSAARCKQNEKAGKITYLSGYYWQASASILEVIAADRLGYFKDLCLDVDLKPGSGDVSQNAKLLAGGKVQVGPLSEQDILTSNASGLKVLGVSSYSDAGLDVLMTNPSVTSLKQLKGKTIGQKGWVPVGVQAMLAQAGVAMKDVKQVKVGYDPGILPRGQVDGLVGFASNEPNQLSAQDKPVKVWQPADYKVPGSLGSYAVNPAFATAHPTAVEDFLRAVFRAFDHCSESAHVDECIGYQHDRAGAEDDKEHETAVWRTEAKMVADSPLPGKFGSIDQANVKALVGLENTYAGQHIDPATALGWFDGSYADKVVDASGEVVWPAP